MTQLLLTIGGRLDPASGVFRFGGLEGDAGKFAEEVTAEDLSVVQTEGQRQVTQTVKHYYLDPIISVGY